VPDDGRRLVADAKSSLSYASKEIYLLAVEEVALVPLAHRCTAGAGYQQRRASGPVRELLTFVGLRIPDHSAPAARQPGGLRAQDSVHEFPADRRFVPE
jgi:hypothetical protein